MSESAVIWKGKKSCGIGKSAVCCLRCTLMSPPGQEVTSFLRSCGHPPSQPVGFLCGRTIHQFTRFKFQIARLVPLSVITGPRLNVEIVEIFTRFSTCELQLVGDQTPAAQVSRCLLDSFDWLPSVIADYGESSRLSRVKSIRKKGPSSRVSLAFGGDHATADRLARCLLVTA